MKKIILSLALIFIFSNFVQANTDQFYIGAGMGGTSFSGERSAIINDHDTGEGSEITGADITGKIYAGYRFHELMGVELGLHRFGNSADNGDQEFVDMLKAAGMNVDNDELITNFHSTGASFSVLGFLPVVEGFELFGKVGLLLSKIDSTNPDLIKELIPGWENFDDSGFTVLVGGGFNAKISDDFSFRTEFEWAPNIASNHFDDTDDQLNAINAAIKAGGGSDRIDYDLGVDIISTTASIIWYF